MGFLEYFKPTKRNLSLTAIIFISQFLMLMATTLIVTIVFPEWMSQQPSQSLNPRADALIFIGVILGQYVAASTAIWWLEEYLGKD